MTRAPDVAKTLASGFHSMPSRVVGELDERVALGAPDRVLGYHVPFLDDYLRGILPHDLIVLGAPSGIGKTDLALSIAAANARRGKRVHYFALEAELNELERRSKYALLARLAYQLKHPQRDELNYTDWYLGRCEHICADFNAAADRTIGKTLGQLYTFYRGEKFDPSDLARAVLEVHRETDLVVIDHLHYIDIEDDNEHRGLGDVVKTVRDVSLRIGKPIILVSHLRKRDPRLKQLVATLDDFHGSSNITKIATQVIALERASTIKAPTWFLSPTYLSILKDRRAGAPRFVAMTNFDIRLKTYEETYTLGRIANAKWSSLKPGQAPSWAKRHVDWDEADGVPTKQTALRIAQPDEIPHAASDPRFT